MWQPDLRCVEDLDEFAVETESPLEDVLQDAIHRLKETPGSNPDDPDRGLGIEDMLSGPLAPELQHLVEAELRKDDRIEAAQAGLVQTEENPLKFRLEVLIQVNGQRASVVFAPDGSVLRIVRS